MNIWIKFKKKEKNIYFNYWGVLLFTLPALQNNSKTPSFPFGEVDHMVCFQHFLVGVPSAAALCSWSTEYFVLCVPCQLNMPGKSPRRPCAWFIIYDDFHDVFITCSWDWNVMFARFLHLSSAVHESDIYLINLLLLVFIWKKNINFESLLWPLKCLYYYYYYCLTDSPKVKCIIQQIYIYINTITK